MSNYHCSYADLSRILGERYRQFMFVRHIPKWTDFFTEQNCCGERMVRFEVFYKTSLKRAKNSVARGCRWCGRVDLD
jgi:hypothetical protein